MADDYSEAIKSGRGGNAFLAEQDAYMKKQAEDINKQNLPAPPKLEKKPLSSTMTPQTPNGKK